MKNWKKRSIEWKMTDSRNVTSLLGGRLKRLSYPFYFPLTLLDEGTHSECCVPSGLALSRFQQLEIPGKEANYKVSCIAP